MEYADAKHIVNKTKDSGWFGFEYNMNIYRGCSHGCIYCDSRSDCYRIENFDNVKPKRDALRIIRDDLRRKVKKGVIGTGAMSDPYNPLEKQLLLTRNALELVSAYEFGIGIATKSPLITRDIDVMQEIKSHSPVVAKITITTSDDKTAKIIEPKVAASSERFESVARLSDAGIFAGLLLMPVLPFIEDDEENISKIVKLAHESGAKFIYAAFGMTMRDGQREYFLKKIDEHYPGMKELYIKTFKSSYSCTSPSAKKLWAVFSKECEKYGIIYSMRAIIQSYKTLHGGSQISLFDL